MDESQNLGNTMNWKRFCLGMFAGILLVAGAYTGREIGGMLVIMSLSLVVYMSIPWES